MDLEPSNASSGWLYYLNVRTIVYDEREYEPVTPAMSFSDAIHAPMLSRILCPAWRWSNVPPSATTGYVGGYSLWLWVAFSVPLDTTGEPG